VTVSGRHVALFRLGDEFYAIDNLCLHKAGPLCEGFIDGNDVDTAPRQVHSLSLDARFNEQFGAVLDLFYVGDYFLDAGNTATYPGHEVVNLRLAWTPRDNLRASLRIDNVFDTAYADRADFAFGDYRYFPARPRALFLSFDFTAP